MAMKLRWVSESVNEGPNQKSKNPKFPKNKNQKFQKSKSQNFGNIHISPDVFKIAKIKSLDLLIFGFFVFMNLGNFGFLAF